MQIQTNGLGCYTHSSAAVQQKLMREADIRTTLNIYGTVVTDEMQQAATKVAELAIGSRSGLQ